MNRKLMTMVAAFALAVIASTTAQAVTTLTYSLGAPVFVGNEGHIPLSASLTGAGAGAGVEFLDIDVTGSSVVPFDFDRTGGAIAAWDDFSFPGHFVYTNFGLGPNDIPNGGGSILLGTLIVDLSSTTAGQLVLIDVRGAAAYSDPFGDLNNVFDLDSNQIGGVIIDQLRFQSPGGSTPAIPEPASLTLGALSLLGLAVRRRKNAA